MVYNGIFMETTGISVMVSIGLLCFFLAGSGVIFLNRGLFAHTYELHHCAPCQLANQSRLCLSEGGAL